MRELEQANATKDRFLASVSHELRTPLHGIIGMAQLMEKTDLDTRQAELLQMMNTASDQLYRILSDLLDTSRMNAGRLSLKTSRFSLDELSSWLEPVLRKAAEEKGLELRLTVSGDSNAVMLSDRDVQIGYERGPGEQAGVLDIEVHDTGRGIGEAEQEEIFSPFTQVSSAPAGHSAGLGLGLSIVKAVTELLGGSVGLSSTPGEGSRFSVRLPVEQAGGGTAGDAPAAAPVAGDKPAGSRGPTDATGATDASGADSGQALIAEDEAINRLYLKQLLESRGWTVSAVGNGEEAVDAAATRGFDLILLDLSMPKLGGLEATRELRKLEAETGRRRAPVIALTAHAGEETKQECSEAGMDGFVSKPFGERALWAELERVLTLQVAEHATGERHPSE
ncbi:MAG: response regulator [Spirochaetes bacterium]|jgi:CheY-like chemotaxis protein|nr:response regulator [Spirochaetota bacterium]